MLNCDSADSTSGSIKCSLQYLKLAKTESEACLAEGIHERAPDELHHALHVAGIRSRDALLRGQICRPQQVGDALRSRLPHLLMEVELQERQHDPRDLHN